MAAPAEAWRIWKTFRFPAPASRWSVPVPSGHFRISYPNGELTGRVKYCVFREIGYFLGIEFEPGSRWSERHYRPQHMLDPRRLVGTNGGRARPIPLPPSSN